MENNKLLCGNNQNLFNALKNVCGFTALQSDMDEIKRAVAKDCEILPDFELKYYDRCLQMTNHLNGVCQKCNILPDRTDEVTAEGGLITLDELGRDYNQDYESAIRFLHHQATSIIASLQQSNEQKDATIARLEKELEEAKLKYYQNGWEDGNHYQRNTKTDTA